ncbi:AI-2E family transporter [Arthrobacter sp. Soc17.1.1.1]|uniref:AI-2E family transporter n=1 Tax=Arthrobacter sp. Soc17.1.1.1 TaxID=3121277 RepID=UPI002FE4D47E
MIGLWILWQAAAYLWTVLFPVLLALLLGSVLWPVNRVVRKILPNAVAALLTILTLLAAMYAILRWMIPSLVTESAGLLEKARLLLVDVSAFFQGPPFNVQDVDLSALIEAGLDQIRNNTSAILTGISSGIYSSVGTVTSWVVIFLLVVVFVFFTLKDGDKFLPWAAHWSDARTYQHVRALTTAAWAALSGYVLAQVAVELVDAVFIGLGLWLLNIPLALPLTVLIFFSAFIPIIGAVTSGLLATIVALLDGGWTAALLVLGIVLLVQQLESNVLQPVLVGHSLQIHPAVVLSAVTVAGTLFGIAGAFIAVPVTAVGTVILRYIRDTSFIPAHPSADDVRKINRRARAWKKRTPGPDPQPEK